MSRDPMAGRVLDRRYALIERIARGGMASVYSATDLRLDRVVAVKIMHPGLGDDAEFAARFVGEARAAARLSHPNVVSVYDQGQDDGVVFLAMEMVHGHTLRDAITQKSPLSPLHAIALIEPVVAALASAHKAGLIHRDVKPENVLIAEDGRVKVADFGLAKAITSMTQHTATGMMIGTVSYVAPEIVTEGRSDARGDVYAVGVILFELLTGHKPHSGETPIQIAYRHVHHDVPAPSAEVPGIPPYVDALVARATARDPEQRPSDARVLKHQIDLVRQALASGVADDPALTADLRPRRPGVDTDPDSGPDAEPEHVTGRGDTEEMPRRDPVAVPPAPGPVESPRAEPEDPWEHSALAALFGPPAIPGGRAPEEGADDLDDLDDTRDRRLADQVPTSRLVRPGPPPPTSRPAPPAGSTGSTRTAATATRTTTRNRPQRPQRPQRPPASAPPAAPPYVHDEGPAEPGRPRRRSRKGPFLLVLALIVAAAVGVGAYYFGYARYTPTPGVLGMTQADAEARLQGVGLDTAVSERAYSDTVAEGSVISTDPGPGGRVLDGSTVDIVISLGVEEYDVPSLKGLTEDQAQDKIATTKLTFGTSTQVFSEKVPAGFVISSDPRTGTTVRPGTAVDLVVSKGREPIDVGTWVDKSADVAVKKIEKNGLVADVSEKQYSDTVPAGRVISQSPQGGTLFLGETVTLVVSLGPELVTVPDGLVASGVDAATAALQAAGLQVQVENSDQYLGLGYVLSTSPGSGEQVPKGSVVILYLI